jgi:class 3 adenylate cyclase
MPKNIRYSGYLCLLLAILLPFGLFSESIPTNNKGVGILIGKKIQVLEDRANSLTLPEVQSFEYERKFFLPKEDTLNLGHTNYSYWLKLQFHNPETEQTNQILEIDYNNIDEVEFYSPVSEQNEIKYEKKVAGMKYRFDSRSWDHRNFLFSVNLLPGESKIYYIRARTMGGLILPIYLWNEKSFLSHDANMLQGLGFYFGIMFVMLIYNLFIFLSMREISYLYYIGYIFGLSGIQLVLTGLGFQHIWFEYPWLQQNLYTIFSTICMSSVLFFAKSFLNIKEISKKLDLTIRILIALNFLIFFSILFIPRNLLILAALIVTLPSVIVSISAGVVSFLYGYRPARYYLLAFSLLILSGLVVVLKFLSILPSNVITDYGLYFGSSMEVVLLSFALASRINTIKREKEEAQAKTLEMQKVLTESYARFVPRDFLANLGKDSILDVKLGDQIQKDMAVLFSDIRSFTTLSEKMTPEENFNFINSYLGRMSPIIQQNRGFIDKFIGDAIMALFDKSALDAVKAGIEMQKYMKVYNSHRNNQGYDPIEIGIGIHTGSLMLGTIGAEHRLEGTVISDTVNLASRIESLTKIYGSRIAVSEETILEVKREGIYSFRFLDRVKVKGKINAVSIYEVIDGDEEKKIEFKLKTKTNYDQAVRLFHEGQFEESRGQFDLVIQHDPFDKVSQLYLKRIYAIEDHHVIPDREKFVIVE